MIISYHLVTIRKKEIFDGEKHFKIILKNIFADYMLFARSIEVGDHDVYL